MTISRQFLSALFIFLMLIGCSKEPEMGLLKIDTIPPNKTIYIDGKNVGQSPSNSGEYFEINLKQGEYNIHSKESIDNERELQVNKNVFIAPNSTQIISLELAEELTPFGIEQQLKRESLREFSERANVEINDQNRIFKKAHLKNKSSEILESLSAKNTCDFLKNESAISKIVNLDKFYDSSVQLSNNQRARYHEGELLFKREIIGTWMGVPTKLENNSTSDLVLLTNYSGDSDVTIQYLVNIPIPSALTNNELRDLYKNSLPFQTEFKGRKIEESPMYVWYSSNLKENKTIAKCQSYDVQKVGAVFLTKEQSDFFHSKTGLKDSKMSYIQLYFTIGNIEWKKLSAERINAIANVVRENTDNAISEVKGKSNTLKKIHTVTENTHFRAQCSSGSDGLIVVSKESNNTSPIICNGRACKSSDQWSIDDAGRDYCSSSE